MLWNGRTGWSGGSSFTAPKSRSAVVKIGWSYSHVRTLSVERVEPEGAGVCYGENSLLSLHYLNELTRR